MKAAQTSPTHNIQIEDPFWSDYIRLVREVMVPYQWEALNDRVQDAEPSHAIRNFKIAAGLEAGEFHGMVFQDSDVAKWLEAAAYLLETRRDSALEEIADGVIDIVVGAQREDGYLNTYFTLKEPGKEWSNLAECHELYCAGHFIEAGTAYFRATGKRKLLDAVSRFADYIDSVFGREPGKLHGYDGHQEIELALVKLYRTTGNEKYLNLSRFFLDQRGTMPHYFEEEWEKRGRTVHFPQLSMVHDHSYSQSYLPVREQMDAEGHAVRLVYMCTAMADIAAETGDAQMLSACKKLWDSITGKRMYITGSIGSMEQGESFSADYDLPGDLAYAETCASVGLMFFARRMLKLHRSSRYADVMERALYNTVIGGMSLDGTRFFYVNPLEVYPDVIGKNKNYDHIKAERQGWFSCACCPPNVARLLASLGEYIFTLQDDALYVELYIGARTRVELGGQMVDVELHSDYVSEGKVRLVVNPERNGEFTLALRMPEWTDRVDILAGGETESVTCAGEDGYIRLTRKWHPGDTVELTFSMPVRRMKSHPLVRQTYSKVALQRGPFVYCLEEADNGKRLYQLRLKEDGEYTLGEEEEFPKGVKTLQTAGYRVSSEGKWTNRLYQSDTGYVCEPVDLKLIPYFAWANRGIGEMSVWIFEDTRLDPTEKILSP
ncbi:glycoside hydrolase family 127 protein [Gorillibacterium timonense]|uniref:glycoside hydrolase family 127 protein n=1 Tax=Gorillibacterium timonense TaxID=1689269 RepID=UPI00071D7292|nr:beta-L-arabinofuranosidase domain-containing protein [Gorillibacterium timonense]